MTHAGFRGPRTSPVSLRYLVLLVCGALATSPTAGRAQNVKCVEYADPPGCYSGTVTWTTADRRVLITGQRGGARFEELV